MTSEEAETLALQALAHILSDQDRLAVFLAATGAVPQNLHAQVADAGFLGGVLDHVLGDEHLLQSFCRLVGIRPEVPAKARALLPGVAPEW